MGDSQLLQRVVFCALDAQAPRRATADGKEAQGHPGGQGDQEEEQRARQALVVLAEVPRLELRRGAAQQRAGEILARIGETVAGWGGVGWGGSAWEGDR